MLKAIHAQEDRDGGPGKGRRVVAKLRAQRLGKAAELVEAHVAETLTYYGFPDQHWRRIAHQQPARADHARDPPAHPRGRRLPRRPVSASTWPRPG